MKLTPIGKHEKARRHPKFPILVRRAFDDIVRPHGEAAGQSVGADVHDVLLETGHSPDHQCAKCEAVASRSLFSPFSTGAKEPSSNILQRRRWVSPAPYTRSIAALAMRSRKRGTSF